jgi:HEAT repeat protein
MLSQEECKTIIDFVLKRISQSELATALGFDPGTSPNRVLRLLDEAAESKDSTQVECAMVLAYQSGMSAEFVPTLIRLLGLSWHERHEDLAHALQELKDPRAIQALSAAARAKHQYLAYDESRALARKCTWALADIGTPEALASLRMLASTEDPAVAAYAQKRIDAWEAERHRKGRDAGQG